MLVMSTSLANDVIEEYEDQSNSEWGGGGGGNRYITRQRANCKVRGEKARTLSRSTNRLAKIVARLNS